MKEVHGQERCGLMTTSPGHRTELRYVICAAQLAEVGGRGVRTRTVNRQNRQVRAILKEITRCVALGDTYGNTIDGRRLPSRC